MLSLTEEGDLRHTLAEALLASGDSVDISSFVHATCPLTHRALETGAVLYGGLLDIINARVRAWCRFQDEARWRERHNQFVMYHS